MLSKFWESIGSDLAERWVEYVFGPAFLFWGSGYGIYVWKTGWQKVLADLQTLSPVQQGVTIILGLLIIVFSSVVLKAVRFPILRVLEGYWPWPFNYLGLGIIALRKLFFKKKYDELRQLKADEENGELTLSQKERLILLDVWAHWHPAKADDLLPTALGNILRARERTPERRYGIDAIVCWPRLWSLLSENVRDDLSAARSSLDRLVELWFWGLLFLFWAFWTPWVIIIGLLWMTLTYGMVLQAAMAYGDLLEAAFDLHRMKLYDALGWPKPKNSDDEKVFGKQLTEFLWRGTVSLSVAYRQDPE